MKILFVLRNLKVGGGTTFLLRAAMGLLARGHRVEVAAQNGGMKARLQAIGVRVHLLPPTPFNRPQLWALLKRDFDIVHACNPTAGDDIVWAMRRLRGHGPAFVLSVHGVLPPSVQNASGNPSLTQSDEIFCFDEHARASLQQLRGMEKRVVRHVSRPVERREETVNEKTENAQTPPRLVMVSRLSKSKGPTALAAIAAVDALQNEVPGLGLHIVGEGSLRGEVQKLCAQVNERHGKIICQAPGALLDPFPAMSGASGVIGTAYVALEALFHRIPVMASGYKAFGVVTPHNLEAAVECNFGDSWSGDSAKMELQTVTPELMIDGFRTVLGHFQTVSGAGELEEMRARLEANHSIDSVAAQLETVYLGAIEVRKAEAKP